MSERFLARLSHFVIVAIMGYVVGFATKDPIENWLHSRNKEDHARYIGHVLSEKPTAVLSDPPAPR